MAFKVADHLRRARVKGLKVGSKHSNVDYVHLTEGWIKVVIWVCALRAAGGRVNETGDTLS